MADPILLCTDGSELAQRALVQGLALLAHPTDAVVVTVVDLVDPMMVSGTGFAGGAMTAEEAQTIDQQSVKSGEAAAAAAAAALGVSATVVLRGEPASTLCRYAEEQQARAIVLGTRGHGGIKRAFLGSVSDHVVRHAPCPVLVAAGPED